ncbi:hypothetical protein GCM10010211_33000 [Streptomyces albospinus]|uniref:Aminotransferase n=1 Tax=Streptomyces albospinus TaxID=285515 RepID=A0ABQ2V254_9ACTN|nr:aminotransferase class III-fold pyridoxal phosphate-dependent enzyme [Streptomyces albospinus]GGU65285.1 hypothetical protein GCM10010211_33000 [Streptomyces albospinus]
MSPTHPSVDAGIPGPRSRLLDERRRAALPAGLLSVAPVYASSGQDCFLTDVDGNRYIDFAGGLGVLNAGHTPPSVVAAVREQAPRMLHACSMDILDESLAAVGRQSARGGADA